ncbi:MAG: holo-ACP synthase [Christensenellales bacterium]|jgi:holo-[acyl-carrier protein] synthase
MIRGLGIDAAEIARFEAKIENKAFCDRVFAADELAYLKNKGASKAQSAAACFAAKEAALKAFGTGIGPLSLQDVWVDHEESGKPFLCFSERAMEKMAALGANRAHLSITHAGGLAIAVVILEDDRQERFEKMFSDLCETQDRTSVELEKLRAEGKSKSLRARELMGKKLMDGATIALIRSYGL